MSCPDCFRGHVHNGTPKGRAVKLHGLDTYISEPPEGTSVKGIVIIIPDAFGWEFVNNRILADHYAEKGDYKVYLPEFMNGNAAPVWSLGTMKSVFFDTGSISAWLVKPYHFVSMLYAMIPFAINTRFSKSWPIVKDFFAAVRENEGASLPIGAAGFCWGGKHTVNLAYGYEAANAKPLIDAGFTGHPSQLEIPSELEKVKKPVSFALGDKDVVVKLHQIDQIRKAVEEKPEGERGEVKVYHGACHGFCVRADLVLEESEQQATEAEEQALSWFDVHFRKTSY